MSDTKSVVEFIRGLYQTNEFIPLHAPKFDAKEKELVLDTLESTFVSSVGAYVDQFEADLEAFTGSTKAVAVVNGTSALHASLHLAGVSSGDIVITQALTFVATCNAISQLGAQPAFVDVSRVTLGMCPSSLRQFLEEYCELREDGSYLKSGGQRVTAAVPMHTFGHPVEIDKIAKICEAWKIILIEDAAESLGSTYKGTHTGNFGRYGVLSFNGNKIITTGGGGAILCNSDASGKRAKHVTTTAKVPHPYEFFHDELGFNYRMPNLNAALGCAQLSKLDQVVANKRTLAQHYASFFDNSDFDFVTEPPESVSNYWLNAVLCEDKQHRDHLLESINQEGVMVRPVWQLMSRLPMYSDCLASQLDVSVWLEQRVVNLPSSPIDNLPPA